MLLRKLLLRTTFRFFIRRSKFLTPIVFLGWGLSFLRWLINREKRSNSSVQTLKAGETVSISNIDIEESIKNE